MRSARPSFALFAFVKILFFKFFEQEHAEGDGREGLPRFTFHYFNFRFLELTNERNGGSMVSLKSPPMFILCVLL